MICLIRPDEKDEMWYIDGCNVHPLSHPDEMTAIQMIYRKTHNGAEIPCFEFGTKKAPGAKRLRDALCRKA